MACFHLSYLTFQWHIKCFWHPIISWNNLLAWILAHYSLLVLFDLLYSLQLLSQAYSRCSLCAVVSTPTTSTTVSICYLFPSSLFPVHIAFLIFLQSYFLVTSKTQGKFIMFRSSYLLWSPLFLHSYLLLLLYSIF